MSARVFHFLFLFALLWSFPVLANRAGGPARPELVVAQRGAPAAVIVVAADAGPWETKAAADLRKYIRMMTGAEAIMAAAAPASGAAIIVGRAAVASSPSTAASLRKTMGKAARFQADAVAVKRDGNRLYVAGSNDESHYFAVSWLLQQWGVRWYMPTEFGEVVPNLDRLTVGTLDFAYSPPFEIRRYWISWNGDGTGLQEFQRRNFMSAALPPGSSHALDTYTADLAPPGGSHFNVPFAARETAEHVTAKLERDYAAGKDINLTIADGSYVNDHPADQALAGEFDRYMLKPSLTDPMMAFYNRVARILRRKHPESRSRIGAMAYSNVTLPPAKVQKIEPNIFMWLAPIDIDPNHAMDDPRSPPKQEYRRMMERWARLLDGRLSIYDYDQGMLVWRDLPNPSHHVFARDVKIYREAGILGFQTESRGALATTFLNLFFRGQLMWNPDADVAALLKEFYPGFYGPAAPAMERYWSRIFDAWERTAVTEHEFPVIPAIYTPELVTALARDIEAAEAALGVAPERKGVSDLYRQRMRFTRAGFELIQSYTDMVTASARDGDYAAAARAGERALAAQQALRAMNPLFVTFLAGEREEGAAWLSGEVQQIARFRSLIDGSSGKRVASMPLVWRFKIEQPLPSGWRYQGLEGPAPPRSPLVQEPTVTDGWRDVRTDLYLQAQGVLAADGQSHLGYYWYKTSLEIDAEDAAGMLRLMFPGLFNEAWLYVNGRLVAHRAYTEPWWQSDYRFEWDVDLSGHLRAGQNEIALRGFNPHHFGGLFRRPFLYAPPAAGPSTSLPVSSSGSAPWPMQER